MGPIQESFVTADILLEMCKTSRSITIAVALWGCLIIGGLAGFGLYANKPGDPGAPPSQWPMESKLRRTPGRATLLVLVHPQCPCTRATAEELARLLASVPAAAVDTYAVLADVGGTGPVTWPPGISGVQVVNDSGAVEMRRFRAETSGQTLLYDVHGSLIFSGGITDSRGHAGDNAGMSSVAALLRGETPQRHSTPVFGCSFRSTPQTTP
jgi:hypothetical protein